MVKDKVIFKENTTEFTRNDHSALCWPWRRAIGQGGEFTCKVLGTVEGTQAVCEETVLLKGGGRPLAEGGKGTRGVTARLGGWKEYKIHVSMCSVYF